MNIHVATSPTCKYLHLFQIDEYICGPENTVPLVVVGGPGTGKSSIMAKLADDTVARTRHGDIPG